MPVLSYVHDLFNVDTRHTSLHTRWWKDCPFQCPWCQSQDVDPRGKYHYRPGCKRSWYNGCARTFNDLIATLLHQSKVVQGYVPECVHHIRKGYARGDAHEKRAEGLFALLKPYLRVLRGLSQFNLPGDVGFFPFLRHVRQQNADAQAELILRAALDPAMTRRAKRGEFVQYLGHYGLLQIAVN